MAMKKAKKGFALLVSVIFMSVMLSFGLTLASLAYKQQVLASSAIESQYAFYAADSAMECALYADQQLNLFAVPPPLPVPSAPPMVCSGFSSPVSSNVFSYAVGSKWAFNERLNIDAGKRCADITVYKPIPGGGTTYIFSQGYDVSCAAVTASAANTSRVVARGLQVHF